MHRYLQEIASDFAAAPVWYIRQVEGIYFLPHSIDREFISDDATQDCVRDWNQWLPIVMSACKVYVGNPQFYPIPSKKDAHICWGFRVSRHFAQTQGLKLDTPVEYIEGGRCLEVFQIINLTQDTGETKAYVQKLLEQNHLRQRGCAFSKVIAKIWEEDMRLEYSILYVPVE